MSPFIDSIQQQFSSLAVPFLCFVCNSQVGSNGPRKHTKLPFQCVFSNINYTDEVSDKV